MCRTSLFCFCELLEDSLDATSFTAFWCLRLRALIRGRSLRIVFIMSVGFFFLNYEMMMMHVVC